MNTENSENSVKFNLKNPNKNISLVNLSAYYT